MPTPASVRKPFDFTNSSDKTTAIESIGRQNKRSLQLKGARSSKKQRREERASLQAALDAAVRDLNLQLPTNNESSSEDECETIDGQDPDPYYGRLINWFSHKLRLGLIEEY